jgi:replicative DNA helicase
MKSITLQGYPKLNNALGTFRKGELLVIASRPAMGKTSLVLSLAKYIAINHNVLFYSLELSKSQLERRFGELCFDICEKFDWATIKKQFEKSKIEVIIIDFIQIVKNVQPTDIARLKAIAVENDCCIIVTSSLTREVEMQPDGKKRPEAFHLEKSPDFSNEAVDYVDKIVFLHRESYYSKDFSAHNQDVMEIIIFQSATKQSSTIEMLVSNDYKSFVEKS